MRQGRESPMRQARATLLWAVLLFAAGQLALGLFVHRGHPEMCDPSFTTRCAISRITSPGGAAVLSC